MIETITVQGKSDLIVSEKTKRTYFTITDATDRKMICFVPTQYNDFRLGADVEVEVAPGKMATDTPRVKLAGTQEAEAKPKVAETQAQEPSGQTFGMSVKEIGQLIVAGKLAEIYGKENAVSIVKWYRGYLASTLKFPYDGAKLPTFEKVTKAHEEGLPNPEDIPY